MDHVVITKGLRHLSGWKALAYARTRKTKGGDVDRARRQQQVIMAIRNKVFSPENFTNLVLHAQELYYKFAWGIFTNMSFEDVLRLAVLVQKVPKENIKSGVIDYTMVTLDNVTVNGQNQEIFKPIPDKIRVLRDEIFTSSGALSPLASGDPVTLMKADAARVRVLNGSGVGGVEARTYNYLGSQGMAVTEAGVADRVYSNTAIVLYSGKLYTLRYLVTLFGINSPSQITIKSDPASTVDVEIRLGADWVSKIPPGF
jgi:hypothetical protein